MKSGDSSTGLEVSVQVCADGVVVPEENVKSSGPSTKCSIALANSQAITFEVELKGCWQTVHLDFYVDGKFRRGKVYEANSSFGIVKDEIRHVWCRFEGYAWSPMTIAEASKRTPNVSGSNAGQFGTLGMQVSVSGDADSRSRKSQCFHDDYKKRPSRQAQSVISKTCQFVFIEGKYPMSVEEQTEARKSAKTARPGGSPKHAFEYVYSTTATSQVSGVTKSANTRDLGTSKDLKARIKRTKDSAVLIKPSHPVQNPSNTLTSLMSTKDSSNHSLRIVSTTQQDPQHQGAENDLIAAMAGEIHVLKQELRRKETVLAERLNARKRRYDDIDALIDEVNGPAEAGHTSKRPCQRAGLQIEGAMEGMTL